MCNYHVTILSKRIVNLSLILYLSFYKSFSIKVAVECLMFLLHIRESGIQITAGTQVILSEIYRYFSLSLRKKMFRK
jgi:hypothetical protein